MDLLVLKEKRVRDLSWCGGGKGRVTGRNWSCETERCDWKWVRKMQLNCSKLWHLLCLGLNLGVIQFLLQSSFSVLFLCACVGVYVCVCVTHKSPPPQWWHWQHSRRTRTPGAVNTHRNERGYSPQSWQLETCMIPEERQSNIGH